MIKTKKKPYISSSFIWAVVLGMVGLFSGGLGAVHFYPSSNLAPIIGVFLTGPGGIIVGFFSGIICTAYGMRPRNQAIAVVCTSIFYCTLIILLLILDTNEGGYSHLGV